MKNLQGLVCMNLLYTTHMSFHLTYKCIQHYKYNRFHPYSTKYLLQEPDCLLEHASNHLTTHTLRILSINSRPPRVMKGLGNNIGHTYSSNELEPKNIRQRTLVPSHTKRRKRSVITAVYLSEVHLNPNQVFFRV